MDEPVVETELADNEPQRRSGPWKLIVVVAVLTLIGGVAGPGRATETPGADDRPSTPPQACGRKQATATRHQPQQRLPVPTTAARVPGHAR